MTDRTVIFLVVCLLLTAGCAPTRISNAPPALVKKCQSTIATEAGQEIRPRDDIPSGAFEGSAETAIEDAAAGHAEADEPAAWPEEVLLYRCLAANGVELTPAQAQALAEWQERTEEDNK